MGRNMRGVMQATMAVLIFLALVWLLFRYFGYYIDPDAVSYLSIAKAYQRGDMAQAVNGLWSPMGSWLTALLASTNGYRLFANAIAVNALGAAGTLATSYCLFLRIKPNVIGRALFLGTMVIFLCYATYIQSFTDIWSFFFINMGLILLLGQKLFRRPHIWVLIGLLGALAYLSKAYSFYFFPVMVVALAWIRWRNEEGVSGRKAIALVAVAGVAMLLCCMPWLYLLHQKYGIWTPSLAGRLNMSWFLIGHPVFSKDITVLLPPRYPHSLYEFEDPWWLQGELYSFWQSPRLMAKQLARIGYNVLSWPEACTTISACYFPLWLYNIYVLLRKWKPQPILIKACILLFLTYPLPFYLISFDGGRYLWYTLPLAMILGCHYIQAYSASEHPKLEQVDGQAPKSGRSRMMARIAIILFLGSFALHPIKDAKGMWQVGKDDYATAQQLLQLGIHGSFVPNQSLDGDKIHSMLRIAYFSNNPIYGRVFDGYSLQEILADAERYKVKYYFYFYTEENKEFNLDSTGRSYPELTQGKIPRLKVFLLRLQ